MKQARRIVIALVLIGVPVYGYLFAEANRSVVALDLLAARFSEVSLWVVVWAAFTAGVAAAALVSLWAFALLGGRHVQVRRQLTRAKLARAERQTGAAESEASSPSTS